MLGLAALFVVGASPVPADDAAVLRDVLRVIGGGYCVSAALDPPPFAGVQRRITDDADRAPTAGQRATLARSYVSGNWFGEDRQPLVPALEVRLIDAAAALALRGDPAPSPIEAVGELNLSDADPDAAAPLDAPSGPTPHLDAVIDALEAEADRLEAEADAATVAAVGADHGRVAGVWLAPGQRLGDDCRYPSASLSAVARAGQFAFVDVGLVGAPLVGIGETWALQRRGGRWVRVARRRTWIA